MASRKPLSILFIGDIVSEPGMDVLQTLLPALLKKHQPDFVIANGENLHEGRGLNDELADACFDLGVHVLTGGNHSFDKHLIFKRLKTEKRILRPFNFPKGNPGIGFGVFEIPGHDQKIGVLNLIGRTFMQPVNDPFESADYAISRMKDDVDVLFVDMHAEATAEKMAMGWHLDGRVSVVVGTHTHIPTSDARILPKGTGYITDVGMTGSFESVLGLDIDTAKRRLTMLTPQRYKSAKGDPRICGVLATLHDDGTCTQMEQIFLPEFVSKRS
jgi:metallophosphoesterase (TIGR00282 family)